MNHQRWQAVKAKSVTPQAKKEKEMREYKYLR
jgi:hypothetical protein